MHPESWYRDHDVDLLLGTSVTSVDARGQIRALIESGAETDDTALADPSAPLESLLPPHARPAGDQA